MTQYTREQLRKLYLKLPQEIKDMASSDETTEFIHKILEDNDLDNEHGTKVSELLRDVLYGLLPPEDFPAALEKDVKVKKDLAKRLAQEINRFVFFPIRESLNGLYHGGTETAKTGEEIAPGEIIAEGPGQKKTKKEDTYRETLE
jgi:hypothetical protein